MFTKFGVSRRADQDIFLIKTIKSCSAQKDHGPSDQKELNALAFDYFWAYFVAPVVHPMPNFLPLRAREMEFLRFG